MVSGTLLLLFQFFFDLFFSLVYFSNLKYGNCFFNFVRQAYYSCIVYCLVYRFCL